MHGMIRGEVDYGMGIDEMKRNEMRCGVFMLSELR
jgi:hypothetical protein